MSNPLTCLHNILSYGYNGFLGEGFIYCASCSTDLTKSELLRGKLYEFDIDHNVWVRVPGSRVERPQARTDTED